MADNFAVIHRGIFTDSKLTPFPAIISHLFAYCVCGKHATRCGISGVLSGTLSDPFYRDLDDYSRDDWKRFREDFPKYRETDFSSLRAKIYPFMDVLEDAGLIKYDKQSHVLKINDIHKYVKFNTNFGGVDTLIQLKNVGEGVHNHPFFEEYLRENSQQLIDCLQIAREKYETKAQLKEAMSQYTAEQKRSDEYKSEYKQLEKEFNKVRNAKNPSEVPEMVRRIDRFQNPQTTPTPCQNVKLLNSDKSNAVKGL